MIPETLQPYLPLLTGALTAIAIFVVGWIVSKWARSVTLGQIRKRQLDEALGRFIANIVQYSVLAAAVIAALGAVGIETTSLVAIFASAGLAVGLALQGSLSNFASGVMVLFFRPFELGDVVTAGGHTGKVDDIGLFVTTLITPDNLKIMVPNSSVTGGSITNITTLGTRRGTVEVGVAYGADVAQVMGILESAAKRADLVHADPGPAVAFVGLGASSIDFAVHCWTDSATYLGMLHNVRTSVYDALNEAGIDIPYNQIVVHRADMAETLAAK